jgi:hypothetical protein
VSTSDLAGPASTWRYPLGAWALALALIGPIAVVALSGVTFGFLLFAPGGWGGLGLGYLAMLIISTTMELTVIGLAVADLVGGDGSGRTAARIALVFGGIGVAFVVWFALIGIGFL